MHKENPNCWGDGVNEHEYQCLMRFPVVFIEFATSDDDHHSCLNQAQKSRKSFFNIENLNMRLIEVAKTYVCARNEQNNKDYAQLYRTHIDFGNHDIEKCDRVLKVA